MATDLVKLLVKQGTISKSNGDALIKQAEDEAAKATKDSDSGQSTGSSSDSTRVTYVPDVVKDQMREEIKSEVMKEEREENWAEPRRFPSWLDKVSLFGDVRLRYDRNSFPRGNDNTGAFVNFNSINTGAPYNPRQTTLHYPAYNVDQNRNRFRLRARFGADVDVGSGFTSGFRIATGSDNSPTTENQTLGGANGGIQGGNFSKYNIWLDRAFIKYQLPVDKKLGGVAVTLGRMDNPFFATSMIWANDLAFDGAVMKAVYNADYGLKPFLTAGAFAVYNTDFNFPSTNNSKYSSDDKYLYAIQGGTDWTINKDYSLKVAGAVYDFENIQGKESDPITTFTTSDAGNTDISRPSFAQNGNTVREIRNNQVFTTTNGETPDYQYYGLASPFREVAVTGQFDISSFDPLHIKIVGEGVKNVAFDRASVNTLAVNNGGAGDFFGGDFAWYTGIVIGKAKLEKFGDWSLNLNYRYVESDAVVDGFTDADFGGPLVGTNLKGYVIEANFGLAPNVWSRVAYLSSESIGTGFAGPGPGVANEGSYKNDLIQVDVNLKY